MEKDWSSAEGQHTSEGSQLTWEGCSKQQGHEKVQPEDTCQDPEDSCDTDRGVTTSWPPVKHTAPARDLPLAPGPPILTVDLPLGLTMRDKNLKAKRKLGTQRNTQHREWEKIH